MGLFDEIARRTDAIEHLGVKVRAEAQATGTPISYTDAAFGRDVIREYPDGRRERLTPAGETIAIPPCGT